MKNKIYILTTIILFVSTIIGAQQLPKNNQYLTNKFALSPAFAGFNGNIEMFLGYRQNWVGIEGSPRLQMIDIKFPLKEKMGIGLSINSEQIGNFRNFYTDIAYAYHLKLGEAQSVSFGLAAKIFRSQIDISSVKSTGVDPLFLNNSTLLTNSFDVAVGAVYNMKSLYVGISIPRAIGLSSKFNKGEGGTYSSERHYLFHTSYAFTFSEKKYVFEPTAIVRKTANSPLNYEAAMMLMYKNRLWTALTYHAGSIFGITTGGAISDRILINYTYEIGIGGIAGLSSGTHEISLGILIKPGKVRKLPTMFPKPIIKEDEGINEKIELRLAKIEKTVRIQSLKSRRKLKDVDNRLKRLEQDVVDIDSKNWDSTFILKNLKFGNNSAILFSSSFPELNKLVSKLKKDTKLTIKISGYTDNQGSKRYNKRLSMKRAKAVCDYLVRQGIVRSRIIYEGRGDENPIGDNKKREGRAKNRRIEAAYRK